MVETQLASAAVAVVRGRPTSRLVGAVRDHGDVHWILFYDLVDDYLERRAPLRDEHLALARAAHDRGELVAAGALADPPDAAVLVFQGDSPAAAEAFAVADPYVANGLVSGWRVRPWTVVLGGTLS